jgi:Flp pilus assembly protein TadG
MGTTEFAQGNAGPAVNQSREVTHMPRSSHNAQHRRVRVTLGLRKHLVHAFRQSESGQALVELALVLPVVLLILLGIIDFGQAFNTENTTNHLANVGARFAAVGTIPSGVSLCAYIDSTAAPSNLQNKLGVAVTEPSVTVGEQVTVQVTDNYHWLKYIQGAVGTAASTAVVGTATMRLENISNGSMACSIPAPS